MMDEYIVLHNPKVRTDITVYKCGRVVISARLAKTLGARSGNCLRLLSRGGELLLGAVECYGEDYTGRLRNTSNRTGTMFVQDIALAMHILRDGSDIGRYRCGEVMQVDGSNYVTIITRKNYADKANRTEGDKQKPR